MTLDKYLKLISDWLSWDTTNFPAGFTVCPWDTDFHDPIINHFGDNYMVTLNGYTLTFRRK